MSGYRRPRWGFHLCSLDERKWGAIGCDVPRDHGRGGIPRINVRTPWFSVEVAYKRAGTFSRVKPGQEHLPLRDRERKTRWVVVNREKRRP